MTDTLTAVVLQLGKDLGEYLKDDWLNNEALQKLIRQHLAPHFAERQPQIPGPPPPSPYRHPEFIANHAQVEALLRESHTERAGVIHMLADIVIALHRQAEAVERIATACEQANEITETGEPQPRKGQ